ncbi:PBZ domain/Uncharacterised conserved protein (DUF2228), putative [Angomonas deanei]|uniref:PBZ domain/Uncharacterized conserved protein (DUF2228), putative n=1 Tax=Angomonas deanei TaxID=59799 RepID=A0A7G2CIP0_9TRYP|nr:PBZ domain/Uncharacterised conserved protein (DUF2228), putative [Angomonas deanei]
MDNTTQKKICPYDGKCYRKNPKHFEEYDHPIQYGNTTTTNDNKNDVTVDVKKRARSEEDAPTPTNTPTTTILGVGDKEEKKEDTPTPVASEDASTVVEEADNNNNNNPIVADSSSDSSEDDLAPSVQLIREILLQKQKIKNYPSHSTQSPCALSKEGDNAGLFLESFYDGHLKFNQKDVQAVLLAAIHLQQQNTTLDRLLSAFSGYRLTGPMEMLVREWHRLYSNDNNNTSKVQFKKESYKWLYARFSADPPECQTVLISTVSPSQDENHLGHVCYHRDNPEEEPTMVVENNNNDAHSSKNTAYNAQRTFQLVAPFLSLFLLGNAVQHHQTKEIQALCWAIDTVQLFADIADKNKNENNIRVVEKFVQSVLEDNNNDGSSHSHFPDISKLLKEFTFKQRKSVLVASTFHHLQIVVPFNRVTEVGYRPPHVKPHRMKELLERWDRSFHEAYHHQNNNSNNNNGFRQSDWVELQDQFQWNEMSNDEGDYGLGLELGQNFFSFIVSPCAPSFWSPHNDNNNSPTVMLAGEDCQGCNPLLWHAWRLLDCSYMLLPGRELYRHIIRLQLPLLAGKEGVLLSDVFVS